MSERTRRTDDGTYPDVQEDLDRIHDRATAVATRPTPLAVTRDRLIAISAAQESFISLGGFGGVQGAVFSGPILSVEEQRSVCAELLALRDQVTRFQAESTARVEAIRKIRGSAVRTLGATAILPGEHARVRIVGLNADGTVCIESESTKSAVRFLRSERMHLRGHRHVALDALLGLEGFGRYEFGDVVGRMCHTLVGSRGRVETLWLTGVCSLSFAADRVVEAYAHVDTLDFEPEPATSGD